MTSALNGQMVWFGLRHSEVRPHQPLLSPGWSSTCHFTPLGLGLLTQTLGQSQDLPYRNIKQPKPLVRAWQATKTPKVMALVVGGGGRRESVKRLRPRSQPGLKGPGTNVPCAPYLQNAPPTSPPAGPSVSHNRSSQLISHEPWLVRQDAVWELGNLEVA